MVGEFFFDDFLYNGGGGIVDKCKWWGNSFLMIFSTMVVGELWTSVSDGGILF